ncbi:hypothetical protein FHT26_002906 [Rhizobacter sp. SG703]|nr:hypothetical protein [Rhizobacter sp. SG703]
MRSQGARWIRLGAAGVGTYLHLVARDRPDSDLP